MDQLERLNKDEVFDILFKTAYGNRPKNDKFPEGCSENLNVGYRRFMIISCIDALLHNIKYEKCWKELQELSDKAIQADSCDVLFPILEDVVRLVLPISEV